MTRLMGDATHGAAGTLAQVPGLELVAGYVTGSPDIRWTPVDWAAFPSQVRVTIDQGFTGSPVSDAIVRDYEPGAWYDSAVVTTPWTAPQKTIYCNRNDLPTVLGYGWRGNLWLAFPGWFQGDPLPDAPGCTFVAIQNNFEAAYDLSIVLDPDWPGDGGNMLIIWGANGPDQKAYLLSGGRLSHIQDTISLNLYTAAGVHVAGGPGNGVTAAEEAALLADFPPGSPAVTVTTTSPSFTITGSVVPQ